ncbi:MAG: restriction endonuclease [Candidatus Hodarchaeales archaeon]|jgi:hypothetical protein
MEYYKWKINRYIQVTTKCEINNMTMNILSNNLQELTVTVFESLGFSTHHPALIFNHPLADSRLNLVLKLPNTNDFVGIIIRDYKRIVGVGQINRAEELLVKCPEIDKLIIVSSMGFSITAKQQAAKIDVKLVTKKELISLLVSRVEFK